MNNRCRFTVAVYAAGEMLQPVGSAGQCRDTAVFQLPIAEFQLFCNQVVIRVESVLV